MERIFFGVPQLPAKWEFYEETWEVHRKDAPWPLACDNHVGPLVVLLRSTRLRAALEADTSQMRGEWCSFSLSWFLYVFIIPQIRKLSLSHFGISRLMSAENLARSLLLLSFFVLMRQCDIRTYLLNIYVQDHYSNLTIPGFIPQKIQP